MFTSDEQTSPPSLVLKLFIAKFSYINSQGTRVKKNIHAQRVRRRRILLTKEACSRNLLVWRHNINPVWRATSKRSMIRTNNEHWSWLQLYDPYYILPIPSGTEWAIPFHLDWFPQIQRLLVKHNIVNAAVKEAVCLVFLRQNKIRFW